MKKFFLIILLIYYSFCDFETCSEAKYSDCANINIGFSGFSCFKIKWVETLDDGNCTPFPINKEAQQAFVKIVNGFALEYDSSYAHSEYDEFFSVEGKKDFYSIGEVIEMTSKSVPKDVISKIKSQKTCGYNMIGRNLIAAEENAYSDIIDKNICFNSEQFDEFKNLVDCGYADISFTLDGKSYNMKTCFYVPNEQMPSELNPFFMDFVKGEALEENGILNEVFLMKAGKYNNDRERLNGDGITFSMEVENKYGRKVKYTDTQNDITILVAGQESPLEETGKNNAKKMSNLILILLIYLGLLF